MTSEIFLRLFIHVEEPSMKEVMDVLLPRLLAGRSVQPKVIDHGSKQGLLTNLSKRMRGYANWPEPGLRVMVLVDRDNDNCATLKSALESAAISMGMHTKSKPDHTKRFRVVNRVVIEELEAWFLGDVYALAKAYPGVSPTLGRQSRFRDPDAVAGGTWEALLKTLKKAGHYVGSNQLPKIEVVRRISPLMSLNDNRSRSFNEFLTGLNALLTN